MGLLSMQHQTHHQPQGQPPSQQHHPHPTSRPSSVVHQQHQQHSGSATPQPPQHQSNAYSNTLSSGYQQSHPATASQDSIQHYYSHQTPAYPSQGNGGAYASADSSDMMAAAHMSRPPYPPISYHTPQSNSPAPVQSPAQHDQHRMYGQPPPQHLQHSMYYSSQPQYQLPPHPNASPYAQPQAGSPYGQHPQHPSHSMTSQPQMMMSHQTHPTSMPQHPQHPGQHAQPGMTHSPRPKIEPTSVPMQLPKSENSPLPQGGANHHGQNGAPLHSPGSNAAGVNPNAAPGPIPATTPLVVRQDNNGVQWIAFEYSRDRVKMEYTIRCDVESVSTDDLTPEFKQENCVYPRACCPKDQYRGNRLMYETECNRVGWALAQLNMSLRGKRGLIQRAVDSWRNSNQDPRLRSRRVRRMAKMNGRKQGSGGSQHSGSAPPHMSTSPSVTGIPTGPGQMPGGNGTPGLGKPSLAALTQQPMHHHHATGHQDGLQHGADEVEDHVNYGNSQHHSSTAPQHDVRQNQIFTGYGQPTYPPHQQGGPLSHMTAPPTGLAPARRQKRAVDEEHGDLFPNLPEAKKRKFILVEDNARGSRLRVRVTLEGVDTREIPDSFRKGASVFPRSYFPREMQSPTPNEMGSRFFADDDNEDDDDGVQDTEGREASRLRSGGTAARLRGEAVQVRMSKNKEVKLTVDRTRRSERQQEFKLNDLGYRMAWLQSRVFAGRNIFLQRALDSYRNKTRVAIEGNMQDVLQAGPHYETRPAKRRWSERIKRTERN